MLHQKILLAKYFSLSPGASSAQHSFAQSVKKEEKYIRSWKH